MFDHHLNQGGEWLLQSSWVELEQENLTCCHPGQTIFFSSSRSSSCNFFFLTPGILMRFLAKKKCEDIAKSRKKMIPECQKNNCLCLQINIYLANTDGRAENSRLTWRVDQNDCCFFVLTEFALTIQYEIDIYSLLMVPVVPWFRFKYM